MGEAETVAVDPFIILLLALAIDAVLGDLPQLFRFVPHPVALVGRAIEFLELRLNRDSRSKADRTLRGAFVVLVLCGSAGGVAWFIQWIGQGWVWSGALELFLVAVLVAQRSLFDHVRAVAVALDKGGLYAGRDAVRHIVGRDPESLDEHGVARAAIESCAENFSDAVVAPVFWYALAGLPGLFVYKTASTLDSMIGHRSARYRAFGMTAARLDDALNLVPARLSALLMILAAFFVPTANPWRALKTTLRDSGHHRSINSGWPEAAMAGALDLALAGPRRYPGEFVNDRWIGEGRARATAGDIRRALFMFVAACLLNAMLVAGLAWVSLGS